MPERLLQQDLDIVLRTDFDSEILLEMLSLCEAVMALADEATPPDLRRQRG